MQYNTLKSLRISKNLIILYIGRDANPRNSGFLAITNSQTAGSTLSESIGFFMVTSSLLYVFGNWSSLEIMIQPTCGTHTFMVEVDVANIIFTFHTTLCKTQIYS